ncbi:zinc-binding dehydrogenase [Micromonospora peucetia]|uniref:NADPH2:quinone reductase n=1 Tax=Micromonospora peucetia TaxID=47871 RepID=A0A1C6W4K4_9ACTN|nr:zinc-binding dehydrogenase [Micromonospora peucetia]MCX4390049.1 zinc-binding dehydrogenase [Micromonospora peucetia]SCL73505.1 NADPH2:quinone reductase [Micromonospora peucetia]
MRVVQVAEFGGPEVLRIAIVPEVAPAPGQVVVDVEAAGVLSIDTVIRSGQGGEIFQVQPPYVPGVGAAGQVSAVGEGIDREWVGRRVLADVENGAYAERVTTELENLIPIPDGLETRDAVALLHDGAGALSVFDRVDVQPGATVLVQPAAGGLGSGLVQLASAAGARVIGAARGSHKLKVVEELGADLVVDYTMPDWIDQIGSVNVVFDGVGGDLGRTVFARVARGGTYSNYGFAGGGFTEIDRDQAARRGVTVIGMEQLVEGQPHRQKWARRVLEEAAAGRIRPVIGQTYPLERAADAHTALENRDTIGKTLLLVRPGGS